MTVVGAHLLLPLAQFQVMSLAGLAVKRRRCLWEWTGHTLGKLILLRGQLDRNCHAVKEIRLMLSIMRGLLVLM